jgi:hypothetical protein
MFIPEFWCGVAATIFAEIVFILISAIICSAVANKQDKGDKK